MNADEHGYSVRVSASLKEKPNTFFWPEATNFFVFFIRGNLCKSVYYLFFGTRIDADEHG